MQETPQQYTQRILAYADNQAPLRVQQATPKKLSTLIGKLNKKQLTKRPAPGKWSNRILRPGVGRGARGDAQFRPRAL